MSNDLVELDNTQKFYERLRTTPYYKKLGDEGVYTVVCTAVALGLNPLTAVATGQLYTIRGKIEMTAQTMGSLIRSKGHSITMSRDSNETQVILHGKRADNGDTMTAKFTLKDAEKAGLTRNASWSAYTEDMLYARALSRLARRLFPDVICNNVYIEGEISQDTAINKPPLVEEEAIEVLGDRAEDLEQELALHPEYKKHVQKYLDDQGLTLQTLPMDIADKMYERIEQLREKGNE